MTSLLTHTVAHSSRSSFRPKTNNQPIEKFLILAVSSVKVVENGKILTFKHNFCKSKIIRIFLKKNSLKKIILGAHFLLQGRPHISWFLVQNGYQEMRGSWIPRSVFSVKFQNGSKKFPKSPFFCNFHEISVRFILIRLLSYLW